MASSSRSGRILLLMASFLFLAVLLTSATAVRANEVPDTTASSHESVRDGTASTAAWTILVYMDADNDLESYAIDDFLEMAEVGSTSHVNIVVQFDRNPNYDDRYGNWADTKRFLVTAGMTPTAGNAVSDIGEVDMGSAATLASFITWGVTTYPAQNYALVMWDHGYSWYGVCWDYTNSYDCLTPAEIDSAMSDAQTAVPGLHFGVIGFDACEMGTMEICAQLYPYTDYFVMSELDVPGTGWNYQRSLQWLTTNYQATGEQLSIRLAQDYITTYATPIAPYETQDASMAAINASYIDDVLLGLDELSDNMTTLAAKYHNYIEYARGDASYLDEYVDLYLFSKEVKDLCIERDLRASAYAVYNATGKAIMWSGVVESESSYPMLNGLGIYYPETKSGYESEYATSGLDLTADTHWDEALTAFYTANTGGNVVPSISSQSPVSDPTVLVGNSQTFSLTISDPDPDQIQYYWSFDGTLVLSTLSSSISFTPTLEQVGTHTISVSAWDGGLSYATFSWTVTVLPKVQTTAVLSGNSGVAGYYNGTVSITLSAVDHTGGSVDHTYYRLDGVTWIEYTGPFTVSAEDSHTLEYYSHSNSGFTEDALSQAFVIDNTVPSVSTGVSGYTLWLNGTDALSGVLHVCYRLDGGALTYYSGPVHLAPGIRHSIEYYAIDKANNWCSHLVIYVGVQDLIAPVSQLSVSGDMSGNGWYLELPTVTMSATDSGESGLKAIYYSIDGSAWSTYSGPITLSSQGTVHLRYYAVDNASNAESIRYANITIDTLSPVLTVDLNGFTAGWGNATSTVSVTSEENGSGIAQIYYSLNNGTWMTYSAALSFSTDTRCFVQFYAVDVAGHTSTVVNVTISVDATDPTCNGTLSGLVDIDGLYIGQLNATLAGSDAMSSVAVYQMRIDGGAWTNTSARFLLDLPNGTHVLQFRCIDACGNVCDAQNLTFVVVHPTSPDQVDDLAVSVQGDDLLLSWTEPEDGGSAIVSYSIYRSVDGGPMVLIATTSNLTYLDTSVEVDQQYSYEVSASNILLSSSLSEQVAGKVPKPSQMGISGILVILVVAAAVIMAVVLLAMRRRK